MTDRGKPEINAIYRHYKGDLYTVLGECVHHESRAQMVLYRSHKTGVVNCRPLYGRNTDTDGWMDPINGEGTCRFELVGYETK